LAYLRVKLRKCTPCTLPRKRTSALAIIVDRRDKAANMLFATSMPV